MEKNTNKPISEKDSLLKLILFTIIYFLVQRIVFPLAAFLFWFTFLLIFGGLAIQIGRIFELSEGIEKIFINIFFGIALLILFGFMYFLGYLCRGFLGKFNKIALNAVMAVILIYFLYKVVVGDQNSIIDALIGGKLYIYCTIFHIVYIIGAFWGEKIKKILGDIKFKRKK